MSKIVCGDSLEILKLLDSKSINLIITDPPYDMKDDIKLLYHAEFLRVCKGAIIIFMPPENQWFPAEQYGFWIKPISTKNTSKSYSRFVEMIHFYNTAGTVWNCKRHWSQYTNVFMDLVDDTKEHAFRKPPSLIQRLMLNHSNKYDLILDPFAGSGVVGEVALINQRNFGLIEQDENKCKAIKTKFGISVHEEWIEDAWRKDLYKNV